MSYLNITVPASACSMASIPYPVFLGAEFLSMETTYVSNYSEYIHIGYYSNHGAVNVTNASFCNVTVSYTHPGQNDTVNVQILLPTETWNGRLQAIGGGGWQAGLSTSSVMGMIGAMGEGYSSISTDAGLGSAIYPTNWGLLSPGNVNLYLLQNLASTSLNDMSVIGKAITESFYGTAPKYSYFSGCSQGGRQGLMLAQRYPDAFDGIAASAPAINWNTLLFTAYWPSFVMRSIKEYPPACEFDAITDAATTACDGIDGVIDGVITDPSKCKFTATSMVGKSINCSTLGGKMHTISAAAATIITEAWSGAKKVDNSSVWYGVSKDALMTPTAIQPGMIGTSCSDNGTCVPETFELVDDWVRIFIIKNASASLDDMTHEELDRYTHLSAQMYDSIIGTNDPDLSAFRKRGGKILGYHGTADNIIAPEGTTEYYDKVTALDPSVHDFYRMFTAPGLGHCFGGSGAYPDGTFDTMRKWVEQGTTPDTMLATSVDTDVILKRTICPYPKKQYHNGHGNATAGEGFYCK